MSVQNTSHSKCAKPPGTLTWLNTKKYVNIVTIFILNSLAWMLVAYGEGGKSSCRSDAFLWQGVWSWMTEGALQTKPFHDSVILYPACASLGQHSKGSDRNQNEEGLKEDLQAHRAGSSQMWLSLVWGSMWLLVGKISVAFHILHWISL